MWVAILTISALNGVIFAALAVWNGEPLWVCIASYVLANLCGMLLMTLLGIEMQKKAYA